MDVIDIRIDNKIARETHQNLLWLSIMFIEKHEVTDLQRGACVGRDELVYNPVYNQLEL